MGQHIEMGPYAFQVERTEHHSAHFSIKDGLEIHAIVRILKDSSAPFTATFDEMMESSFQISDAAGNTFDGYVAQPVDDRVSEQQLVKFIVAREGVMGWAVVRDAERMGKRASDFRLTIENPDPRGNQPRRVVIQLR